VSQVLCFVSFDVIYIYVLFTNQHIAALWLTDRTCNIYNILYICILYIVLYVHRNTKGISASVIVEFDGSLHYSFDIVCLVPRSGYDYTKDPELQDLCLGFGFIRALYLLMRIKRYGLAWLAVPCNSFSFMASSQHCRKIFQPYGNWNLFDWVRTGNVLCTRSCILIAISLARTVTWFVENPLNSSLPHFPGLHHLLQLPCLTGVRISWSMPHLLLHFQKCDVTLNAQN